MLIGCPREIKNQEFRVGLTPESAKELVRHGHRVWIESGAGLGIGATDEQYRAATRLLQEQRAALDAVANALLKYETLSGDEIAAILRGDNLEEFRQAQLRQQQQAQPRRADTGTRQVVDGAQAPADKKPDVGLSGA